MRKGEIKKRVVNIAGIIFVAVSFVFIIRRFSAMNIRLDELLNPAVLVLLITMPFLSVMILFLLSFCWKRSLVLFTDRALSNRDVFAAYTKANLAKYLPGNVGHYAARQMFGAQMGLKQWPILLASLFEIGYSSFAMLTLSLALSANAVMTLLRDRFGGHALVWISIAVTAGLVVLGALGIAFRKNKYAVEIIALATKPRFWLTILGSFAIVATTLFAIGAMFAAIVSRQMPIVWRDVTLLLGGSIAGYFIGFITPGVPGGIGVREAAMLFLLAPFFPSEIILFAAIVQRVIMVVGDVIAVPISALFKTRAST